MIRKILGLCEHQWKDKASFEILNKEKTVGHQYIQRCETCGKIRKQEV
jgi:hypothetical protein